MDKPNPWDELDKAMTDLGNDLLDALEPILLPVVNAINTVIVTIQRWTGRGDSRG